METKYPNMAHLLNGGKLITKSDPLRMPYKIACIGIVAEDSTRVDSSIGDIEENFTIYVSPEQKEIEALKQKVEELTKKLETAKALNKAIVSSPENLSSPKQLNTRPLSRQHLTIAEVREIESILKSGKSDVNTIAGSYAVTPTTIYKIVHGTHAKSTLGFSCKGK